MRLEAYKPHGTHIPNSTKDLEIIRNHLKYQRFENNLENTAAVL
jgi:hypothetical protein